MSNPRLLLGGRSWLSSELAVEFADRIRKAALISLVKAGAAQESTGRHTMPTEKQAKREYEHSFIRQPYGVSGEPTPDLPERGRDWHGTVEGVPDEDQTLSSGDDESEHEHTPKGRVQRVWENPTTPFQAEGSEQPVENEGGQASAVKNLMDSAVKAFAGAPRFAQGPLVPPREKDWLLRQGYSPEEVMSGQVQITPRMRGEFNRWLQGTIRKSLDGLRR